MHLDYFAAKAARSDAAPARWRRPFLTWLDGIENGWSIPLLIAAFAAAWWLFLIIAYQSGDLHADALETWSLGRDFAWGNPKHPPLMGWVAWLWTRVFPLTDWSFQLLSMTNAAVALFAVDLIARRFVRGDSRAVVLMLLMLTPVYQFYAQRFNANTVLLAIWPLATYCQLRAFETRAVGWSIAAGVLAALAMLGKYYSVFLIASFALAALAHPQRMAYFKSWAPWLSSLAGLVVLGPHLHWQAMHDGATLAYPLKQQGGFGLRHSAGEATMFLLGIGAALAIPAMVWTLAAGRRLNRFFADFRAMPEGLLLLFWMFVGTAVLPPITAMALGTNMPSLWAAQGLFLPVLLIVCGASFTLERFFVVNIATWVIGIAVIAITVAAPIHAIYRNGSAANERTYYRLAVTELTKRWHEVTKRPMVQVSGDDGLAFAAAFYSPDHPRYSRPFQYQYAWGIPRPQTLARGWVGICFADDTTCVAWMDRVAALDPNHIWVRFDVQPTLWGRAGKPSAIVALMVPPRGDIGGSGPQADLMEEFSSSSRNAAP